MSEIIIEAHGHYEVWTFNGEARRNLQSGAVRVNDKVVQDDRAVLTEADLLPEGVVKLSLGRKKHALIRPV